MALSAIIARLSLDDSEFRKGMQRVTRIGDQVSSLGAKMSVALTLPIAAFGKVSGEAYARYDSLRRALDTITGSSDQTAKRLEALREAARSPGLGFEEAIQGDVRLRAVGVSAEQSIRILKEFGNTIAQTGGGKTELRAVTVQLGQLIAKGKVYAQDLKPIIEAAPAVGKALKDLYGTVDSESIQQNLAAANKTSEDFINTLLDKLAEAPRVSGGFKNALENVRDSLFVFSAKVGETANNVFGLDKRIDALSVSIAEAADRFQALPEPLQKFILGTVAATAAAGPFLYVIGRIPGIFLEILKGKDALFALFTKVTNFLNVPLGGKGIVEVFGNLAKNIPLVTAAAAGFIAVFRNLGPIGKAIQDFTKYWIDLYDQIKFVRVAVDSVVFAFKLLFEFASFGFEALIKGIELIGAQFANTISGIGAALKAALKSDFSSIPGILAESFNEAGKITDKYFNEVAVDFAKTIGKLEQSYNKIGDKVDRPGSNRGGAFIRELKPKATGGGGAGSGTGELTDLQKIVQKLNEDLLRATNLQKLYGDSFDGTTAKVEAYQTAIESAAGVTGKGVNESMQKWIGQIAQLQTTVGNVAPLQTYDVNLKALAGTFKSLNGGDALILKLKADGQELSDAANGPMNDFRQALREINALVTTYGANFDAAGARTAALSRLVDDLAKRGLPLTAEQFKALEQAMKGLSNTSVGVSNTIAEIFRTLPQSIQVQSVFETDAAVKELNRTLREQQAILLDPKASEAQKKAAQAQIATTKQQIKEEKDKGNIALQVGKSLINVAREVIAARLAEAVASAITGSAKLPFPANIIAAGLAAGGITALFQSLVPKLASGGLAFAPTLAVVGDNKNARTDPEVISPLSKLKQYIDQGGGGKTEIFGRLKGLDLLLSNQYTEEYYKRVS